MYKQFFHLNVEPFSISPDPRFLYKMPHTQEALAGLRYGISDRKGFVVLTGEAGSGKTTLIHSALRSFDSSKIMSSFIFNPRLDALEFLEFILTDFGITPQTRSKSGMLMQFNRWLIDRYKRGEICVLIVDEAQNLSLELLEEIRLLTNLETSSEKLLQIVLSGQPEFEDTLRKPAVRQLRQRISVWCRTHVLDAQETGAYIRERLSIAGTREQIFPEDVTELIQEFSRGVPRTINVICDHSLIQAYAEGSQSVSREIVLAVAQDFGFAEDNPSALLRHRSELLSA